MRTDLVKYIFSFSFSFLITFYLIPILIALATRLRFVDIPDGKVKNHKKPIPYMGGVAVYIGFLCAFGLTVPFDDKVFLLLIGSTLLLLVGLIDDLVPLKPYQKFFGQFIGALCFLKTGFYLKEHVFYNVWNLPLSLFWILIVINAFNLVDVMDGLATSIAIEATITFALIAVFLNHFTVLLLLLSFLGSLCAFFWYNKPSASIYLGDAGALFIGGLLAVVPFLFDWGTYTKYGYFAPIIILAIPLLECSSLIVIRASKGIPFYKASPDHFSIYLKNGGFSCSQVLIYIAILSLVLGISSNLFVLGYISFEATILIGIGFLAVWGGVLFSA